MFELDPQDIPSIIEKKLNDEIHSVLLTKEEVALIYMKTYFGRCLQRLKDCAPKEYENFINLLQTLDRL